MTRLSPGPKFSLRPTSPAKARHHSRGSNAAGLSLVEVMGAVAMFAILSVAVLTALIQSRKMSEDNVAQATAAVIAQGIIEQVQLNPYDDIADTTVANLELKFTGANANNLASIQQYLLPWAPDTTTFTQIGARVDPADPTSAVLGVLLDLDYTAGAVIIRPKRYMKMQVNMRRIVNSGDDNVQIILTYSWQPPSRLRSNVYLTREIRTIRSQAPSY